MRYPKRNFLLGLLTLVVVGLIVWAFLPKPVPVDLAPVVRGPLQVSVDQDGKTRIKDRYTVSAPLSGQLWRIGLKAGDAVQVGKTLLAVLEPNAPELLDARSQAQAEARVSAAQAAKEQAAHNLERLRATAQLAQADLARATELRGQGVVSPQESDIAQERDRSAAQAVSAAEFAGQIAAFELEQAEAALLRFRPRSPEDASATGFRIVSPIDGRVLRVFQESAATVAPGTPLLELGDPANLEVVVDVLSSDAVKIRPGAKVLLEHWGGDRTLPARVRLVEPAGFLKVSALGVEEQRVNVLADFVDPPEQRPALGDAYRVEARIVIWDGENVLKVPANALFRSGESWAVFQVANDRAHLRSVKIGHSNGLESEVLGGLTEKDRVILYPGDRIKDGARVRER